jgi:hypothetical protein
MCFGRFRYDSQKDHERHQRYRMQKRKLLQAE